MTWVITGPIEPRDGVCIGGERSQRHKPHHRIKMEFFSLSELGDPKIFQTEETKYVVVNMEDSEGIIRSANEDNIVTANDSDDIIRIGRCEPEPGLYETNKELFYSLAKFFEFDQPSSVGVKAPEPFWISEEFSTENPLLNSGKIDIII